MPCAHREDDNSSGLPFPKLLATIGYVAVWIAIFVAAAEVMATIGIAIQEHRRSQHLAETFAAFRCRGTNASRCVPRDLVDLESASPVYDGQPWAEAMWRDFRALYRIGFPYSPFLEWASEEFHGEAVNVDPSPLGYARRTVAAPNSCPEGRRITAWLLGGSTAFGWGTPDTETIASHLAAELRKQNPCVDVLNLAAAGYDSNQELLQTVLNLKRGSPPAVLVLFDGYNDGLVGVYENAPATFLNYAAVVSQHGRSAPTFAEWLRNTNLWRGAYAVLRRMHLGGVLQQPEGVGRERNSPPASSSDLKRRAAVALDNYEANLNALRRLADAYHFRLLAFWQPSLLYGRKPPHEFERLLLAGYTTGQDSAMGAAERAVYAEAESRASATHAFVFLGDLFDSTPEPVYMDPVHLGPLGSTIAARAIAEEMARQGAIGQHSVERGQPSAAPLDLRPAKGSRAPVGLRAH